MECKVCSNQLDSCVRLTAREAAMPSFSRKRTYSLHHDKSMMALPASPSMMSISSRNRAAAMAGAKSRSAGRGTGRHKKNRFKKSTSSTPGKGGSHKQQHHLTSELQELLPAQPVPSEPELNTLFAKMVDELGLNREIMWKLPPEKKWQLYLSRHKEHQTGLMNDSAHHPQLYVEETLHLLDMIQNMSLVEADIEENLKIANNLKTALRTQPLSFVLQFIDMNGLEYLLDFLRSMNSDVRQSQLHYIILGSIKALMNNSDGRAHVLAHPTGITVIAQSLKTNNFKIKILTLEILGAVCLVPGGHKKVLNAMVHFQQFACERTRFQTIVMDLAHSLDADDSDSAPLQVAILSFLNALINYKAGEESLEFRLHLRYEFLMLGIQPVIARLRFLAIPQLTKHIEIFEFVRVEDEREFAAQLNIMERVDYTNVINMSSLLQKKTAYTPAYVHLVSLLYHCLLLPVGDPNYDKYWRLIDRMVQQAVIQQDHGVDPDMSPLKINVQKLVVQLLHEDEQRLLIKQMEDMKRAQEHFIIRIKKMEWECERTTMERDAHQLSSEKLKTQLENKIQEVSLLKEKQLEMEGRIARMMRQEDELKTRCEQLEERLKEKKVDISDLPQYTPPAPPPAPPPVPPPPPPPPGGLGLAPAPPPPPAPPGISQSTVVTSGLATLRRPKKKKIPQASNPLKAFNWEKMAEAQIGEDMIWADLDESHVYQEINIDELEKTFQQKPRERIGSLSTGRIDKPREKTFINNKRAQNCSILLTRLKMTDTQIRHTVLTMDPNNNLDKDMVEQLLKYVPLKEEVETLRENLSELDSFSRADKFMLEMSNIPRYEKRLKALSFTKTFRDRIDEIRPAIEHVTSSCHELLMSDKLRKLLEVILAFGNIMNRGHRGNAFGFKLSSLNRIVDTKSTTDNEMTLLHYLVQMLEAKFPDVLTLESDLPHICNACKVDLGELEKEFKEIKKELANIRDELEYNRMNPSGEESDKFVSAVEDFALHAAITVREVEHFIRDMKEQFHKALHYFGEDPRGKDQSPMKFFGAFDKFLKSLSEAHIQLITMRKKKEEEEKRKKDEEQRKMDTLKRRKARQQARLSLMATATSEAGTNDDLEGNLDELIARLQSGEPWNNFGGQGKKRNRRASSGSALTRAWMQVSRERVDTPEMNGIQQEEEVS